MRQRGGDDLGARAVVGAARDAAGQVRVARGDQPDGRVEQVRERAGQREAAQLRQGPLLLGPVGEAPFDGDAGARQVLRGLDEQVLEIPVADEASRLDIDTPDALQALPGPFSSDAKEKP